MFLKFKATSYFPFAKNIICSSCPCSLSNVSLPWGGTQRRLVAKLLPLPGSCSLIRTAPQCHFTTCDGWVMPVSSFLDNQEMKTNVTGFEIFNTKSICCCQEFTWKKIFFHQVVLILKVADKHPSPSLEMGSAWFLLHRLEWALAPWAVSLPLGLGVCFHVRDTSRYTPLYLHMCAWSPQRTEEVTGRWL